MLAAFGCVLGVYAVLLAIWVPDSLTLPAPVHVCIGLSFVGAGTVAWLRRPDNRTGMLMTITGLVWFGRDFDWLDTAFTTHADALATNLFIALVAHQLVVFPDGRTSTRLQRTLVYSGYGLATLGYALTTLGDSREPRCRCGRRGGCGGDPGPARASDGLEPAPRHGEPWPRSCGPGRRCWPSSWRCWPWTREDRGRGPSRMACTGWPWHSSPCPWRSWPAC